MNLIDKIKKGIASIRDMIRYIKEASEAAVIRLFHSRRRRYEALIRRLDDFNKVIAPATTEVTASEDDDGAYTVRVDGDGVVPRPRGRRGGTGQEAVRFKDGTALPVESFHMPSRQQLAKDVRILDEAEEYRQELLEMIMKLRLKKDAASKKVVREMQEYADQLEERINRTLDSIEELHRRHLPQQVLEMVAAVRRHLNDTLPADTYDDIYLDAHLTSHDSLTGKNAPLEFTHYLEVEGLDKDVFNIERFMLVVTSIVHEIKGDKGAKSVYYITFHVTSLNRFQRPGHFAPGVRISGGNFSAMKASMVREVNKLIALHGLAPTVGKRKLNVTQQQLRASGVMRVPGVVDVDIVDDEVLVYLARTRKDVIKNEIWPEVLAHIRRPLRVPRNSGFIYTLDEASDGYVMRIVNVMNLKG